MRVASGMLIGVIQIQGEENQDESFFWDTSDVTSGKVFGFGAARISRSRRSAKRMDCHPPQNSKLQGKVTRRRE